MSIGIDVDTVTEVLLADGWHTVADQSFGIDSYEYVWSGSDGVTVADQDGRQDPVIVHEGGQWGVCASGFMFKDDGGARMAGPLTAVLAVRYAP